jgi:hypothetical protein
VQDKKDEVELTRMILVPPLRIRFIDANGSVVQETLESLNGSPEWTKLFLQ